VSPDELLYIKKTNPQPRINNDRAHADNECRLAYCDLTGNNWRGGA